MPIILVTYKILFLWMYFMLLPSLLFSQNKTIESLSTELDNALHDTVRISLNYKISKQLADYDVKRSDYYLEKGYRLAKGRNNKYDKAYYFKSKAELLFDMTKYNTSSLYFDSAIVLFNSLIDSAKSHEQHFRVYKFGKTDCLIGKGLLSAKLYNYTESTQYYLDAIDDITRIAGKEKNIYLANLHADIASNYYELEQFTKALEYDKKGLSYLSQRDNQDMFVIAHLFVADDFSGLLKFDSSTVYLEKVRTIVTQLNKPNLNVRFYYILGGIYRHKKEWQNALINFKNARDAAEKMKDDFQILNSEEGIAASYMNLGNLDKAREIAVLVLNKSKRINLPLGSIQSLQLLTEIEEKSGNIFQAFQYQKQWMHLNDSVNKVKVQRQMQEVEAKYQSEKKEKEIIQLQKNNLIQSLSLSHKSVLNYILIGSITVLLVVFILVYRNISNRQLLARQQDELQQQKIRELEKDKQLVAVDSMLKGQEDERSRMAKDLHDGLGGMLSSVKFTLGAMKGNTILSEDNTRLFSKALDQLDHSISEMRRVAHNMMPEALVKFGVQQAIEDYCNSLREGTNVIFNTQLFGLENRLNGPTEITVYRIIQELLNNVVRHANATEVFVQVMRHSNTLNITIEDNGKGFNKADTNIKTGAGLANVRARVDYLKGEFDIQSNPDKGTSVHIDFIISDN